MLMVLKFGGTSLADARRMKNAARIVTDLLQQGHQAVTVVSAQGHMTDEMILAARHINPRGAKREMDAYLSAGEQMSAGLLAMAIGARGFPAVSLSGGQAGLETDGVFGDAKLRRLGNDRIARELSSGKTVVVAGFQGVSDRGDITTLGRGGSDTTAVALAGWLGADKCKIYTDVEGVYDRDPRVFPDATKFSAISYGKMLELIENGAQVLHLRSVQMARDFGIPIEVLSALRDVPGTLVGEME